MLLRTALLALVLVSIAPAQKYYTYVGNLASDSVLLAWGTADGKDTIGRSAISRGEATVRIAGRTLLTRQAWIVIADLTPNTDYPYEVRLSGNVIGQGTIRTWPTSATRLTFFAIGDWGNGSKAQYAIAKAMEQEFQRRNTSGNPVRFVISLGDNIYGDIATFLFGYKHTGDSDVDWRGKFFEPYEGVLRHIPFYPILGNHDGNETERRGDLTTYLDNFFFPQDRPARWYRFQFADLAEFFALDTTRSSESGPLRAVYLENSQQFQWMREVITTSGPPWKIPYFHHPVLSAGPRHAPFERELAHWVRLFQTAGVKVAFSGHEHNLQFSEVSDRSAGIRFVTSGAGGELRDGNILRKMKSAGVAGWAPQCHFLVVEIEGKTMRMTPVGYEEINVRNPDGGSLRMPLTLTLP